MIATIEIGSRDPAAEQGDDDRGHDECEDEPIMSRAISAGVQQLRQLENDETLLGHLAHRVRGPSRVLPESLTPPYGIWSARKVGASLTVTPPNSSRCAAASAVASRA
jgi:hypothetical protein